MSEATPHYATGQYKIASVESMARDLGLTPEHHHYAKSEYVLLTADGRYICGDSGKRGGWPIEDIYDHLSALAPTFGRIASWFNADGEFAFDDDEADAGWKAEEARS